MAKQIYVTTPMLFTGQVGDLENLVIVPRFLLLRFQLPQLEYAIYFVCIEIESSQLAPPVAKCHSQIIPHSSPRMRGHCLSVTWRAQLVLRMQGELSWIQVRI